MPHARIEWRLVHHPAPVVDLGIVRSLAMQPCPSCGSPLDRDGICSACGALSRGYFRGLDLGVPQVAAAVAHGLDFYQLLEVSPESELRLIARRYRQLRALF